MNKIEKINQIVAVGSVDGILTTAALLRALDCGRPGSYVDLVFTQAFAVDKIDVSAWRPERKVAFVDLAVNNRDKSMTKAFVEKIKAAGHEIVAICDEHDRNDWLEVLGTFDGLLIEPQSQSEGVFKSSGAVLQGANILMDGHSRHMCNEADNADAMIFEGRGYCVNAAIKSKIDDDSRRVYLARHFAKTGDLDDTIRGWVDEYQKIVVNHEVILANKQDLGAGIVKVSTVGKTIDATTLMGDLYRSARVVVIDGEIFDKAAGKKVRQVSFGTADKKLDLFKAIKAVVPTASGFASKMNLAPEFELLALEAVRALLQK